MRKVVYRTALAISLFIICGAAGGALAQQSGSADGSAAEQSTSCDSVRRSLSDAPRVERQTLTALLRSDSWPRRAVAAARLERYSDDEARTILTNLLGDPSWQVQCYAIRSMARVGAPIDAAWIADQHNPRVLRTLLRHRYTMDMQRLRRGVQTLADSNDLHDKMLAAELGAASGDEELIELATETLRTVILRMGRTDASLSPRLAALTNVIDPHRAHLWRQWVMKKGRGLEIESGHAIDVDQPTELSPLARLDEPVFSDLEQYIEQLGQRHLDLAIVIDCTASMFGELAQAQGEIDSMMLFVGDMVASLRVGIVAYRDRRDRFETKGWDFTSDIGEARRRLWTLTAEGGGDGPELVYEALKGAYLNLSWNHEHKKVLVLIGDAPPHVGYGAPSIELAKRGFEQAELVTHVIEADGDDERSVKHFPQIAEAGGGRCVSLGDNDSLIVEITGLTFGERFGTELSEFFRTYLELCR